MSILVVDDSKFQRIATQATLRAGGYEDVLQAGSVKEALVLLESNPIDLILLDVEMPETDGLLGCRLIKERKEFTDLPVIMLTVREDAETFKAAFDAGAMDFINKSATAVEVATRVRSALKLKHEMDRRKAKEQELLELTRKLTSANQMLRDLAVIDSLTQIPNRRYFDEVVGREWRLARRDGKSLALIMIDIDYFKRFNDTYGHSEGDVCLKKVARVLSSTIRRPGDSVARYGGEEFAAVLGGTDLPGALQLAENMRAAVVNLGIPHRDSETAEVVTISAGAASVIPGGDLAEGALLLAADNALYEAKKLGRNRVAAAQSTAGGGSSGR